MTTMKKDRKDKVNVPNLRFPKFEEEWEWYSIEKIANLSKGSGISKDQLSENGHPCILYGELYTKYKSEIIQEILSKTDIASNSLVKSVANDVIIPSSGESAIDIATARCVPFSNILLGGDLNIIRLKSDNGSFLSYQLNGVRKYDIAKVAQGVSVVHLYGESLKKIQVSICSEKEQEKIANFLSLLDERIATQNKIIEKLESLIKGISQMLFKKKYHWIEYYISDIATVVCGGTPDTTDSSFWNGKIQWFTPSEIGKEKYVTTSKRTITELGLNHSGARLLPANTILLSTRATIGECSIAMEECATNQGVQSLTANNVDYEFLYYLISTKKNELLRRSSGSTFSEISANELRKMKVIVPPFKEQQKIANILKTIDLKISIERKILNQCKKQKDSLLERMFI